MCVCRFLILDHKVLHSLRWSELTKPRTSHRYPLSFPQDILHSCPYFSSPLVFAATKECAQVLVTFLQEYNSYLKLFIYLNIMHSFEQIKALFLCMFT